MTVKLPKLPDAVAMLESGPMTWEAATATGSFIFPTHALLMKAIVDEFSRHEELTKEKAAVDPYNHNARAWRDSSEIPKRRTLDDMQRDSEEIKAARRTRPE